MAPRDQLPAEESPICQHFQRAAELVDAFRLTRYFLDRLVFEPRGVALPDARDRFIGAVARL